MDVKRLHSLIQSELETMEQGVESFHEILIRVCGKISSLSSEESPEVRGEKQNWIKYLHNLFLEFFLG